PRFVDTLDGGHTAAFGDQHAEFLSVTLREQVVLSPRLTAQVYAQLFSGAVSYGQFYSASLDGAGHLPISSLALFDYGGDANGHSSALVLDAVLRWEYRLGSTLFLVYTRSQSELPPAPGQTASTKVAPAALFEGP